MAVSKEELVRDIERARRALNESIDEDENYENIYHCSVELDHLIEQYIVAGY